MRRSSIESRQCYIQYKWLYMSLKNRWFWINFFFLACALELNWMIHELARSFLWGRSKNVQQMAGTGLCVFCNQKNLQISTPQRNVVPAAIPDIQLHVHSWQKKLNFLVQYSVDILYINCRFGWLLFHLTDLVENLITAIVIRNDCCWLRNEVLCWTMIHLSHSSLKDGCTVSTKKTS